MVALPKSSASLRQGCVGVSTSTVESGMELDIEKSQQLAKSPDQVIYLRLQLLCGRKNLFWSAGGALKNPFGFRACTHFEQRKSNETYLNEPSRRREILNIQLFRERLSEKMCT